MKQETGRHSNLPTNPQHFRLRWFRSLAFCLVFICMSISIVEWRSVVAASKVTDVKTAMETPFESPTAALEMQLDGVGSVDAHRAIAISSGWYGTCVVLKSGGVACWGGNGYDQRGDGTRNSTLHPMNVVALDSPVTAIASGSEFNCALMATGGVKCWGRNLLGQVGNGTPSQSVPEPVYVSGLQSGGAAIAAGENHACALMSSGKVKCWGHTTSDDGATYCNPDAGNFHKCDLAPVEVSKLTDEVSTIAANGTTTCVITASGGVKCWGGFRETPQVEAGLTSGIAAITLGRSHKCALTTGGGVKCWGDNTFGQLGNGTNDSSSTPVDVMGLTSGVVAISAVELHTCAVISDGSVKCWGANNGGQMGPNGDTGYCGAVGWGCQRIPVAITGLKSEVIGISSSGDYTCAILIGLGVQCWGANGTGGLGNDRETSAIPGDVWGLETTPPNLVDVMVNDNAVATNSTAVSVVTVANDATSGIAEISLSNDDLEWSDWQSYSAPTAWSLSAGDGQKTVYVRVRDGGANISTILSDTIIVETLAPTGTIVSNNGETYTLSSDIALSLSAHDVGLGLSQMSFSNDGITWSGWEAYASSKIWTVTGGDGHKNIYARFKDIAGNVSPVVSTNIFVDTTSPVVNVNRLAAFQPSGTFTVSWSGLDNGSGLASYDIEYRNEDGEWTAWQTGVTQTEAEFSGMDGHTYAFRARARDLLGNTSSYSPNGDTQTLVDEIPPTLTSMNVNGGALATTMPDVTVFLSGVDATSGITDISFSNDDAVWSPWEPYTSTVRWSLSEGNGRKSVYARIRDGAGHLSNTIPYTIALDTSAGNAFALSINHGSLFTNRTGVTLTLGAPANTMEMMVSNDGGFSGATWEPFTTQKNWEITSLGSYVLPRTVYVRYKGLDNSVSSTYQDDIILDVTPPTGTVESIAENSTRLAVKSSSPASIKQHGADYLMFLPSLHCGSGCSASTSIAHTIRLNAQDDVSGVAMALLSASSDFATVTQVPYTSTPTIVQWEAPESVQVLYVRFVDNAGNVSETVSQSLVP